jgi:hypothetical protein
MEENEPDFISPHRYLKVIYLLTADYPHYFVEARSEAVLMRNSSALAVVEATEKGFATGGRKGLLETLHQQQTLLYERGLQSPYFLAVTCSLQGNKQEALRYLKIAYDQHDDSVPGMATQHAFDNLHNEPAFRRMLADVGLPPAQLRTGHRHRLCSRLLTQVAPRIACGSAFDYYGYLRGGTDWA